MLSAKTLWNDAVEPVWHTVRSHQSTTPLPNVHAHRARKDALLRRFIEDGRFPHQPVAVFESRKSPMAFLLLSATPIVAGLLLYHGITDALAMLAAGAAAAAGGDAGGIVKGVAKGAAASGATSV